MHRLQITKYRGSDFVAGEYPVSFGPSGMEVGAPEPAEIKHVASSERVSAGFERLDTMLGGGLFRGSSTLITGVPGTSKTTLAGKFAEAACRRGERTLFVSFDEGADRIARNLTSVGIQLKTHVKSGLLRMYSGRTESIGAEDHLVKLKALIREHRPRCMVIDPLSAIAKAGGIAAARAVANRFIYLAKDEKITVLVTAINEGDEPETEATDLQISTIADTWIHLSYLIRSGERNRALTIIKSRGTWHSNQVRELVLSNAGPMLADVYTAGGEVLMGTLRWEKEGEEKAKTMQRRAEFDHKRAELQVAEADTRARIKALQQDLERQRAELAMYSSDNEARIVSSSDRENELRRIRSADPAGRATNGGGGRSRKAWRLQRFRKIPEGRPRRRRVMRRGKRKESSIPPPPGTTTAPEGRMRRKPEMRRKRTERDASDPAVTTVVVMRLYIANNAPNSVRAVANLEAICKEHLKDQFKLEIIDVLEYPQRALADGILVTPSLDQGVAIAGGEDRRQPQRQRQRAARARNNRVSRMKSEPARARPESPPPECRAWVRGPDPASGEKRP